MSTDTKKKAIDYVKNMMKKAHNAINLVIGDSEIYFEEDTGGDLPFDPSVMMKINVTFDKDFLPKEKTVKLNVRGNAFFTAIKRDIREVNGIIIVYPQVYEIQFDVRRDDYEKRLIKELNNEYNLALKKIYFFSEADVCSLYQRNGITSIHNPYNLSEGELLIICGGFSNFNCSGFPLATIEATIIKEKKQPESHHKSSKSSAFKRKIQTGTSLPLAESAASSDSVIPPKEMLKTNYKENYYGKFDSTSGAFFFVGGEWYHNLFIPELYHRLSPRYFSFRIADDGRDLKFFSDYKERGIDIRSTMETISGKDSEKIIYSINPQYLNDASLELFKLAITYDLHDESPAQSVQFLNGGSIPGQTAQAQIAPGQAVPVQSVPGQSVPDQALLAQAVPGQAVPVQTVSGQAVPEDKVNPTVIEKLTDSKTPESASSSGLSIRSCDDILRKNETRYENTENRPPFLQTEMIFLPHPADKDISTYMMIIGGEKKNIKFYTSSMDKEITILSPDRKEELYKRSFEDVVDYSKKIGNIEYGISNTFISKINDTDLKLYFAWELKSSIIERIYLDSDFYLIGREPLSNLTKRGGLMSIKHLIRLHGSDQDFWRIGTSRDHGLLLRDQNSHTIYNISTSYPVYLIREADITHSEIHPLRLEPITEPKKIAMVSVFLKELNDMMNTNQCPPEESEILAEKFHRCSQWAPLSNNDLVIIGNRVFKYGLPIVMESPLSDRATRSILRKIQSRINTNDFPDVPESLQ